MIPNAYIIEKIKQRDQEKKGRDMPALRIPAGPVPGHEPEPHTPRIDRDRDALRDEHWYDM